MEVYVVGSLELMDPSNVMTEDERWMERDKMMPELKAAGQALGHALAKAGHTIRVGLSQWSKLEKRTAISG